MSSDVAATFMMPLLMIKSPTEVMPGETGRERERVKVVGRRQDDDWLPGNGGARDA